MSLTVKAYLTKGASGEQEIRRFPVDQDVSTNYNYLVGKITSVFPVLQNKAFRLHWRGKKSINAENDLVVFSSDEELTTALGFVEDGIFKVYIDQEIDEPKQGGKGRCKAKRGHRRGPCHYGVVCDGCEGPIFGTRFKCQTCPNYDLCGGCRSTGLHGDHPFDDIETPRGCPFNAFGGGAQEMFGGGPHEDGAFGGYAAPGVWFQGGLLPGAPPSQPFHPWGPGQAAGEQTPWGGREMFKMWRRKMKEMYGCRGRRHGKAPHCHGRKARKGEEEKTEKMDTEAAAEKKSSEGQSVEAEEKDVEESSSSSSSSSSSDSETEGAEDGKNEKDKCGRRRHHHRHGGHHKGHHGGRGGWWGPWGMRGGWGMRGCGMRGGMGGGMRGGFGMRGGIAGCGMGGGPGGMGEGMHGGFGLGGGMRGGMGRGCGMRGGMRGFWAGCTGEKGQETNSEDQPAGASNTAEMEAPKAAENPKIAEGMETMRSMGFSDDGGWLEALVTAHHGDIDLILDAIHANRQQ